jgi:hypothetical protein
MEHTLSETLIAMNCLMYCIIGFCWVWYNVGRMLGSIIRWCWDKHRYSDY